MGGRERGRDRGRERGRDRGSTRRQVRKQQIVFIQNRFSQWTSSWAGLQQGCCSLLTSDNLCDITLGVDAAYGVGVSWVGVPVENKSCRRHGEGGRELDGVDRLQPVPVND